MIHNFIPIMLHTPINADNGSIFVTSENTHFIANKVTYSESIDVPIDFIDNIRIYVGLS